MFNALFYLQFNSVKNRLTMRFKRLKQPKYLIGLIVGGLYFYWYFFRVLFVSHSHYGTQSSAAASPVDALFYESLGALIMRSAFRKCDPVAVRSHRPVVGGGGWTIVDF